MVGSFVLLLCTELHVPLVNRALLLFPIWERCWDGISFCGFYASVSSLVSISFLYSCFGCGNKIAFITAYLWIQSGDKIVQVVQQTCTTKMIGKFLASKFSYLKLSRSTLLLGDCVVCNAMFCCVNY